MICCGSNAKKSNASSSEKSEESQDELVHDYVNALDGFAQVMPKFGQDTEAEWAARIIGTGTRFIYNQIQRRMKKVTSVME